MPMNKRHNPAMVAPIISPIGCTWQDEVEVGSPGFGPTDVGTTEGVVALNYMSISPVVSTCTQKIIPFGSHPNY